MGVEFEMIGETRDDSLNDQIEDETDFVEVLALETNRVRDRSRTPVVLEWDKEDMDDFSTWMLVLDVSVEVEWGER